MLLYSTSPAGLHGVISARVAEAPLLRLRHSAECCGVSETHPTDQVGLGLKGASLSMLHHMTYETVTLKQKTCAIMHGSKVMSATAGSRLYLTS